jgi:hypothetical protein
VEDRSFERSDERSNCCHAVGHCGNRAMAFFLICWMKQIDLAGPLSYIPQGTVFVNVV